MTLANATWLFRPAIDTEIYYDRKRRIVYRQRPVQLTGKIEDLSCLPSFDIRSPLKAYLDFTYLCNLQCRHCMTNSSPYVDRKKEMTTDKIKSLVDELTTCGVLEIAIGGGEPLTHPDLIPILRYIRGTGINCIITTNGTLIDTSIARALKEIDITEARVSFDGSEKIHDSIRGNGIYQRAIQGLQILVKSGVNAVARLTLCNDEETGLESLFQDLSKSGVTLLKASVVELKGRAALIQNKDLLKYQRNAETARILINLAKKYDISLSLSADMAIESNLVDRGALRQGIHRNCGAGLETVNIAPNGDVIPCSGIPNYTFGNLMYNSFHDIWTGPLAEKWRSAAIRNKSFYVCNVLDSLLTNNQK